MNDSLRVLAARFASFQATANGEFDAIGRQMVADASASLGQTTRNVQDARAQLEALKEQANSGGDRRAVPAGDTTHRGGTPGVPGAGDALHDGQGAARTTARTARRAPGSSSCSARSPNSTEAPRAQFYIGVAYANDRNIDRRGLGIPARC